jgi:hypothetical protein
MKLNDVTTLVKAALADDATDDDRNEVAELRKALGLDEIDEKIDTIQTEVATTEDLDKVVARLTQVETTVIEHGPVRAAPKTDPATAANEARISKISHYENLAAAVRDPALSNAYKLMADDLKLTLA